MASSQQYISPGSATNGTTSESLKPLTPANPTPTSTATATATTPPKGRSSLSPLLPPRVPVKSPGLSSHAPLAGATTNRQGSRSPRNMSSEDKKKIAQRGDSPNPALLDPSFVLGTSGDGGQKESSPAPGGLEGLPHVAAAAAAMDTSASSPTTTSSMVSNGTTVEGGSSTVTAGPGTTDPALMPDISQYHPIHPQPPKLGDPSATTPVSFGQNPITPSSPFSPSGGSSGGRGKHQCTNCFKTFTRHHNLKSHLLTHAHEKPYLCTTCQARFRRLHDLKRHSKLHTGERPHVCIRCGRRFARGDALARHSRGDGGCAGRRGSMGGMLDADGNMMTGMGGDGDDGLDGLEGLMDDGDGDVTMMDNESGPGDGASEENPRSRVSLPSIRTDLHQQQPAGQAPMTPAPGFSQRHPQHATYPPAGPRAASNSGPSPNSSGGLYPSHSRSSFRVDSTVTSPSIPSATTATTAPPSASILSPQLTDSPSAVSPGMTTAASATTASTAERSQSFSGNYLSVLQPPRPAPPANMAANTNVFAAGMEGVWAYIRTLEDRIKNLEDRLSPVPLGPPPPPSATATAAPAHAPASTPTTSAPTA